MVTDNSDEKKTYQVTSKLLELSTSKNIDEAKKEWEIISRYWDKEYKKCLCGHYPIKEIVVIGNRINGEIAIIGNCCELLLYEQEKNNLYRALKEKKINQDLIEYSHLKNFISNWEKNFLTNVWRKRKLSEKQNSKINQIKERIFFKINSEKNKFQSI
jgi:hypothetical protein